MKFWQSIAFTPMEELPEVVQIAEEVGFTGVGMAHHLVTPQAISSPYPYSPDGSVWWDPSMPYPDPWITATMLAGITKRIKFVSSVYLLALQDPFSAAKSISTAAYLTGNRIALGVGAGWMKEEYDLTGQDFRTRGRRLDEMLEVMGRLFQGGMVEYHGTYYDFPPVQMAPVPSEPVPVFVGGDSPAALRRAANADGWFGARAYSLEELVPVLTTLSEARRAAGSDNRPFEIFVGPDQVPDIDLCRRYEDLGVTSLVILPMYYLGAQDADVNYKRRVLTEFAESTIARMVEVAP